MSEAPRYAELPTEPVHVQYELDDGPGRFKIGLIALATDLSTERDFRNMLPGNDVAFFVNRVANVNPCTLENLRTMAPQLTQAASLILPDAHIDVMAYSCTSGTVAIGFEEIVRHIHVVRPGIPCTTPITAALAGFEKLGIHRIVLLTPYIDDVNQPVRHYLEDHGISVLSMSSFNMQSDIDMARLPPTAIQAAALQIDRRDADAVFISCTAVRAAEIIEALEQTLGKPVLSSNQVLFWEALRLAGYTDPVPGFGRLLREH